MAKTPLTSSVAYASAADLLNAHDAEKIGDYARDDGTRLTPGAILTSTVVAAALLRSSGEVESACVAGERYTPSDLAALTGASQAHLKGIVCDLAFYHLAKRRKPDAKTVPGYMEAQEALKSLRLGETIFGFQETADAGTMSPVDLSQDSTGLLTRPTDIMRRRFGPRLDRLTSNPITGQP